MLRGRGEGATCRRFRDGTGGIDRSLVSRRRQTTSLRTIDSLVRIVPPLLFEHAGAASSKDKEADVGKGNSNCEMRKSQEETRKRKKKSRKRAREEENKVGERAPDNEEAFKQSREDQTMCSDDGSEDLR